MNRYPRYTKAWWDWVHWYNKTRKEERDRVVRRIINMLPSLDL
jgi:hypothetical protein